MALAALKTLWEHHRENRIPYPENRPDWVEYSMWYDLCDKKVFFLKKAESSTGYKQEFDYSDAAMYNSRANAFLEAHVRGAIRDAEQGMRPECIAETEGAGPDDPVCVHKWSRDRSPSESPLPEFYGKRPLPPVGTQDEEYKYFGYEKNSEQKDPRVIRERMDRCAELSRRYPDDLSRVEMTEWRLLHTDIPWVWLKKIDPAADCETGLSEIVSARDQFVHDTTTEIGHYLDHRRKAKAAYLRGDWDTAMKHIQHGHYAPSL